MAVPQRNTREGALRGVLGSPSSSTFHKDAGSHLLHLAMGSRRSDSTAVHPTLPEQMCLKAQFSLFWFTACPSAFSPCQKQEMEKTMQEKKQTVKNKELS